ncbi:hypothetical protein FHS31_002492 [Sphingomonas vulcanisoli]|uniref:Uncharacterized protein n=1 Tax=Sphingomonas vulcanisoli TaxID=1658060 RepID=A0ABX0TV15_9SPHN|nr:hypothetical protein [Sphingomonas vulcanisoli]NIJ08868.1 hypothetical protein [Sphingomonas vulcanisoli]
MSDMTFPRSLHSVAEVTRMIEGGAMMLLAGEEHLLRDLPRGDWIGGTIPYFMTAEHGGVQDQDRIFVARLPQSATVTHQALYDADTLPGFPAGGARNGFSVILLPSQSAVHSRFALEGSQWPGLFDRPVVGWVTGVALDRVGIDTAKVFDGRSGLVSETDAVVMHVALPDSVFAKVDIVNLFDQGDGDTLTFDQTSFSAEWVRVGGKRVRLLDYIAEKGIDTKLPLVADYNGAGVNVAIARIIEEEGRVEFFAPVFADMPYRFAKPIGHYPTEFEEAIADLCTPPTFSCNCVLNYAYADLEGQRTGTITGPMTFGEIAYVLLTQTLVYLTIESD